MNRLSEARHYRKIYQKLRDELGIDEETAKELTRREYMRDCDWKEEIDTMFKKRFGDPNETKLADE